MDFREAIIPVAGSRNNIYLTWATQSARAGAGVVEYAKFRGVRGVHIFPLVVSLFPVLSTARVYLVLWGKHEDNTILEFGNDMLYHLVFTSEDPMRRFQSDGMSIWGLFRGFENSWVKWELWRHGSLKDSHCFEKKRTPEFFAKIQAMIVTDLSKSIR